MYKASDYFKEGINGKAVLLCHSLGHDVRDMIALANELSSRDYTVSIPLYPGHGSTFEKLIATSVRSWYKRIEKEYDLLRQTHKKVFVVGMSIGGTFSVVLAQNKDVGALATINAPIIPFDLDADLKQYFKQESDKQKVDKYVKHRKDYFHFVSEIGQLDRIRSVTAPLFVLQGLLDGERYKISSSMIMEFTSSKNKQRKDYSNSGHLLLLGEEALEAIRDIADFFDAIVD